MKLFANAKCRSWLSWQQIDLENRTVRMFGKGKKRVISPLHPMVVPLFIQYKYCLLEHQLHPKEPVFLIKAAIN